MAKDLLQQHLEKFKDSFQNGLISIQHAVQQQSVGGSNFYPTTLDLQAAVKSGWLKKLSSVMKLWQKKWFVLKGDNLYYYSSNNDLKPPQGCIFLPCCHIEEQTYKATEIEKFVFSIIPDERNNSNQEIYILSAESEEERMGWVKVIKKIMYGSIGGAIFGSSLEETLRYEETRDASRKIPEIVEACVQYITKHGMLEEGIFRLPGRSFLVKKYADLFDKGERPSFDNDPELDVHAVASLLKMYLRELPVSLIPPDLYEGVVKLVTREMSLDPKTSMEKLRDILLNSPKPNYNLLQYLCKFLNEISQKSSINKMNAFNLGTVFSTAFLRPEFGDDDAGLMMATSNARKSVTFVLIENHAWLFNVELTPFGGTVVVEDLLGLKFTNEDVISINSGNSTTNDFKENSVDIDEKADQEYGIIMTKDTFKDLLEIDFNRNVDPVEESVKNRCQINRYGRKKVPMRRSTVYGDVDASQDDQQKTKELNRRGLAIMSDKDNKALNNSIRRRVFTLKSNEDNNNNNNDNDNDQPNQSSAINDNCEAYGNVVSDVNYCYPTSCLTKCPNNVNNNNNNNNNNCNTTSSSKNNRGNFDVELDNQRFYSPESLYNYVKAADCDKLTKTDCRNLILFLLDRIIKTDEKTIISDENNYKQ